MGVKFETSIKYQYNYSQKALKAKIGERDLWAVLKSNVKDFNKLFQNIVFVVLINAILLILWYKIRTICTFKLKKDFQKCTERDSSKSN